MGMRIIIYFVVGIGVFVLYVRYLEYHSIFYPSRGILATPADIRLSFEDVRIKTEDAVTIHGWFIPSPRGPREGKGTLIFLHGNAGNIGDRLDKIKIFNGMGLNILIVDYRGYGQSEGRPTEAGIYKDAVAAYDHLLNRRDVDPKRIIAYGASLGGTAAVDLATKRKLYALIIDSSFTNAVDMAKRIYPFIPSFLVGIKMDNIGKIKTIAIPKLFIHSKDDEIIPWELGRRLFEAAAEPKKFLEIEGGHNEGYWESQEKFSRGIESFLTGCGLDNGQ